MLHNYDEQEAIAIIAQYPNIYRLFADKLNVLLFTDSLFQSLFIDIKEHCNDEGYSVYKLMAKYGNALPNTSLNDTESLAAMNKILTSLVEKHNARQLFSISKQFVNKYEQNDIQSTTEVIDSIIKIQTDTNGEEYAFAGTTEFVEHVQALSIQTEFVPDFKYNIANFDDYINGTYQTVCYIAGRPGMFKTSLALNMLVSLVSNDQRCIFFSMEMSKKSVWDITSQIVINRHRHSLVENKLNHNDFDNLTVFSSKAKDNMLVSDHGDYSVRGIERAIMNARVRYGVVNAIFIDNLNLINRDGLDEYNGISKITRELKNLSRRLNIAIFVIAHLNRANSERKDKRPKLTDLRGSGSIEQDADYVLFLHREDYYYYDEGKVPPKEITNVLEWHFAKNRFGKPASGKMHIDLALQKTYSKLDYEAEKDYKTALFESSKKNINSMF